MSEGSEVDSRTQDQASGDIHALADAITTCIEAITLLGDRRLEPAMVQALNNQENILADVLRRHRRTGE